MAKIKIKDIPKGKKISMEEMRKIIGGADSLSLLTWPTAEISKTYTTYVMKSSTPTRTGYFDGQFLGADDLESEQEYEK